MHSEDDKYLGRSFDSVGLDNVVSVKCGNYSLNGSWLAPSRNFFCGGKAQDVLDGGV